MFIYILHTYLVLNVANVMNSSIQQYKKTTDKIITKILQHLISQNDTTMANNNLIEATNPNAFCKSSRIRRVPTEQ